MEQTLQYFKQSEKVLDANQFENEEDRQNFMANVFAELEGLEYRLSCNHDGSMVVEKILRAGNSFHLRVFFEKIREKLVDIFCHRYASHVGETWIRLAAVKVFEPVIEEGAQEGLPSLQQQLDDLAILVTENFVRLGEDAYGTHALRLLVSLWSGKAEEENKNTKHEVGKQKKYKDPTKVIASPPRALPGGEEKLSVLADALFFQPKELFTLPSAILHKQMSPFLQLLLPQLQSTHATRVMDVVLAKTDAFTRIAEHEVGSRFLEVVIKMLPSHDLLTFFNRFIKGNVDRLLGGVNSNFILQSFISECHNLSQFELFLKEIEPLSNRLIIDRRHGVLLRATQWVIHNSLQGAPQVMELIMEAFGLKADRKKAFWAISCLQTKESLAESSPLNSAGCTLLALLPLFPTEVSKPVIDGFLDLSVQELLDYSMHAGGSRVIEAILDSANVSDKVKQRTIRKVRDHVDRLAADKYGSHIVDRCWRLAPADLRERIVAQLATAMTKLSDSPHGKLVLRNCRVAEYERDSLAWIQAEDAAEKKRMMFAEFLDSKETEQGTEELLPAAIQAAPKKAKKNGPKCDGKKKNKGRVTDDEAD